MRNSVLFCLLFIFIGFQSCKKANEVEASKVVEAKPINTQCFQAVYESDTIYLEMNTLDDGKISGEMMMKLEKMPVKTGKINGEFRGDTLFADYSFIQGANENRVFKNPIAVLKRGEEFILGNGQIETYLGASYFAKGKPIDFDKVKYKFTTVDCAVKK